MINILIELPFQMLDESSQSDQVSVSGFPFSMLDNIRARLV